MKNLLSAFFVYLFTSFSSLIALDTNDIEFEIDHLKSRISQLEQKIDEIKNKLDDVESIAEENEYRIIDLEESNE